MAKRTTPIEPTYENQLARLVAIVDRLESGDLSLAESVALYEEGVALGTQCQQLLDSAELRVQRLTMSSTGPILEPWAADE